MLARISKKEFLWITSTGLFIFLNFIFIWFFWQRVISLTMLLIVLAVLEMIVIGSKKLVAVFILAAIGAAIFESISIHLGIWSYNAPTFYNIPIWLIPGWGNAAIIIITFYKLMDKLKWLNKD